MTNQEIRKKILRLSGLAGLYAESPEKEILALGKPAIPVIIDIFENLALPEHGEVQEGILLLWLELFAKEGDVEAIRFIRRIANGKVALKSGTAGRIMQMAQGLVGKYKHNEELVTESPEVDSSTRLSSINDEEDNTANIEKVDVFFEPMGMVASAIQTGASVGIPLDEGIPDAIRTADEFLGMEGTLVSYASNHALEVQITEEKSDAEWAQLIGMKCSPHTRWKRWNAETTQGRWNIVVFLSGSKVETSRTSRKMTVTAGSVEEAREELSTQLLSIRVLKTALSVVGGLIGGGVGYGIGILTRNPKGVIDLWTPICVIIGAIIGYKLLSTIMKPSRKAKVQNVESLFNEGTRLYSEKKIEEAEIKLKKALDLDPASEDIMYNLALVYLEKKQYGLAWDLVDKIRSVDCKELIQELKNSGFVRENKSYKTSKIKCPECGHIMDEPDWRCPKCYCHFENYDFDKNQFEGGTPVIEKAKYENDSITAGASRQPWEKFSEYVRVPKGVSDAERRSTMRFQFLFSDHTEAVRIISSLPTNLRLALPRPHLAMYVPQSTPDIGGKYNLWYEDVSLTIGAGKELMNRVVEAGGDIYEAFLD